MDQALTVACYAFAALAIAAVWGRRYLRTRRALREPIGSDVCIGCGSDLVTTFAPGCHRCVACTFTWGDGLKAHAAQQRRAQLAALDAPARRRLALDELERAGERLLEASLALEHAGRQLLPDMLVGGGEGVFGQQDPYSRARSEGLVKAHASMKMAQKNLRHAADALGDVHGEEAVDLEEALIGLDTFLPSVMGDLMNHHQVERLKNQLAAMRDDLARARQRLTA